MTFLYFSYKSQNYLYERTYVRWRFGGTSYAIILFVKGVHDRCYLDREKRPLKRAFFLSSFLSVFAPKVYITPRDSCRIQNLFYAGAESLLTRLTHVRRYSKSFLSFADITSSIIPVKKDWIPARTMKPQTISVGNLGTSPV